MLASALQAKLNCTRVLNGKALVPCVTSALDTKENIKGTPWSEYLFATFVWIGLACLMKAHTACKDRRSKLRDA